MGYLWIAAALGLSLVGGLATYPANALQPAGETQLGDEAELDARPELVRFVEVDYPPEALRRGIEGTVLLDLVINETGRIDSVSVAEGIDPSLDAAAVRAARDFVFTPAMAGGESVAVLLQYEYTFSIREETRRITEYLNFSGTLREKGTRAAIPDAVVAVSFPDPGADTTLTVPWEAYLERLGEFGGQFLEGESVVTYTDSLGHFAFKSLPSGPLLVAFPNAGYPFTQQVEELGRGAHLQVDYWLERTSYDEYELVVYGKAEDKEVTRQRLELAEVEKIPGLGGDALRVVQTMPGVARPTFMWGDVIVRGSSADDTRFYLDGVDIPLLFHFGGLKSTYNSLALSSIDLYPGGFNTRYGGCVGGVIEIKGRPGPADGWHGILDLNLLDASAVLGGPIGKRTTLTLTGRRSYISSMFALAEDVFTDVDLSIVPYYWDLVGRADIDLHDNHNLFLTAFSVGDEMRFIFEGEDEGSAEINEQTDELYMKYRFDRFILGLDSRLGHDWDNELRLSIGKDNYVGRFLGYARYDFKLNTYTLRNQLSYRQLSNLTYNLGFDLYSAPLDYEVLVLGSGESFEEKTFSDIGTYLNIEYRPTPRALLIPGIRYDYYRELKKGEPSFRLTTQYELSDTRLLKAAVGSYSQSPRPIGQSIDPVFGNPDLPPTTAMHYTVGTTWQIKDRGSANVDLYYNTQEKIPNLTGDPSVNFLPDLDARMYGFELLLRHNPGRRFFGWISYSLSRSERRSPRKPDSNIAGEWDASNWYVSSYDQTHHLQLVASYMLGRNWQTGVRLRYVTGNPNSPRLGYLGTQYEFNSDFGEYTPLQGAFHSERMGPFAQIDFRIDKRWVFKKWALSTYLDVQNLNYFVYNSPEMYIYSYDDSERKSIGGIILPALGIRAEF